MTQSTVLMKTDTPENWSKCEDKYIPAEHTIIVYDDGCSAPRLKMSDGKTLLRDLPFFNEPYIQDDVLVY